MTCIPFAVTSMDNTIPGMMTGSLIIKSTVSGLNKSTSLESASSPGPVQDFNVTHPPIIMQEAVVAAACRHAVLDPKTVFNIRNMVTLCLPVIPNAGLAVRCPTIYHKHRA
jgi:hypothetical protein